MSLIQIIYLHHQMKGDWIAVPGSFGGMPLGQYYEHHGIDLGDGRVIHYTSDVQTWLQHHIESAVTSSKGDEKHKPEVIIEPMESFTQNGKLPLRVVENSIDDEHASLVISRAMQCLGERDYHLLFNNCEHFASWAYSGDKKSEQVNSFTEKVGGVGGVAAAAAFVSSAFKSPSSALPLAATLVGGLALASSMSDNQSRRADQYRIDSPRRQKQQSSTSSALALAAVAAAGLAWAGKQVYDSYFGNSASEPEVQPADQFTSVCVIEPGCASSSSSSTHVHSPTVQHDHAPAAPDVAASAAEPGSTSFEKYALQIDQMRQMGFDDDQRVRHALEATGGDIHEAVLLLMN